METVHQVLMYVIVVIEVISLLLSLILVYCSLKVQPIKKPPGTLVLVEMIFISIIQLLQVIFVVTARLSVMDSSLSANNFLLIVRCISIYCTIVNCNYEICIVIELNLRLKVRKNVQPYSKRSIIYHSVSHVIGLASVLISLTEYLTSHSNEEFLLIDYHNWFFWLGISYLVIHLIILSIFGVLTGYKNSKLSNTSSKRFITKVMNYIIVLFIVRILTVAMILTCAYMYKIVESEDNQKLMVYNLIIFLLIGNLVLYILRLNDPYIVEFLKYRLRAMKFRMKDKITGWKSARERTSDVAVNQSFLQIRKLFDEIVVEKIEYQLIALSIAMLKSQESEEEMSGSYEDEIYNKKTEISEIKSNDLCILSSTEVQNKYFNYRCEYKQYAPDVFQDILAKEGINLNEIANSLFIEDNQESIKRFINHEENNENYFITYDEKYILKTLSKEEHKQFYKHTLKLYHQRIMQDSFLQRIYGLYKLTYNGEYVRVMVIKNSHLKLNHHVESKPLSKYIKLINNINLVQSISKDIEDQDFKLILNQDEKNSFFNTIQKDLDFLKTLQVFNFSILFIPQDCSPIDHHSFHAEIQNEPLSLSIVITDFITAKLSKSSIFSRNKRGISTSTQDSDDDIKSVLDKLIV